MMDCLSIRAEIDVPVTPASPAPAAVALPIPALPTVVPVVPHVAVLAVAGERVGIVGANERGPTVPVMGNTPVVGTAGAELIPRLLISIEPNGIPVRAPPPGVVGNVDVDVGVDDEAMLLEPEPHIPDIPDVPSIPKDVDVPNGTDICDDVDDPGVAVGSVVAALGAVAVVPVVAAVAGVVVPAAVPPPSKLAVDPNIPDDEVPTVEHDVAIAPVVGIAIVPVTPPVGAGLTPSVVISLASIGIPAAPTDPPGLIPRGEVVPSEGIAVSGSSTSTWANAGLAHSNGQAVATIKKRLMEGFPDKSVSASPHSMASVRVIRPRWSWQRGNSIKKAFIVRTSSNTRLSLRARSPSSTNLESGQHHRSLIR